jgi:hypothetical protein
VHFNLGCTINCAIFSIQISIKVHHCKDMPKGKDKKYI